MTAETDLFIGFGLYLFGMAVMVGVALATPRFYTEGMAVGFLFALLGVYILGMACWDLYVDEWEEDL